MLMLSIDSSSQVATAAVLRDGELLCEYTQNQMKTHSVKMLPMIEQMLKDVELKLSDIDVFACGIGPGSFTGVRIGVATVRGFAKTLNKKAVPVNSLEILANNVSSFGGSVFALLMARENECYAAVYENGKEVVSPCVMTTREIAALGSNQPCLLVGDGALKNREFFQTALPDAKIAFGRSNVLSAASLGEIAFRKSANGAVSDCEGLIPLYLRKSQAEREYDERIKTAPSGGKDA